MDNLAFPSFFYAGVSPASKPKFRLEQLYGEAVGQNVADLENTLNNRKSGKEKVLDAPEQRMCKKNLHLKARRNKGGG